MKPRTRARSLALQVLYEVDIAKHPAADIYKLRLEILRRVLSMVSLGRWQTINTKFNRLFKTRNIDRHLWTFLGLALPSSFSSF